MNLLFFVYSLQAGGAERVTANLANHWARIGWRVTVVTLTSTSSDAYQLDPSVCRIALGMAGESTNVLAAAINNLRRVLVLRRLLKQASPDVAVAMMSSASVLMALATIGCKGLATIGTERIHPPKAPLGFVWELLRSRLYGHLGAVVALTEESACWLRQHTLARRVLVVPNGVIWPMTAQDPCLIPPSRSGASHILLAAGRLCEQKGFHCLIAVFRRLADDFPDWRLVILGEGPDRAALEAQLTSIGLAGKVSLPGRAGNMEQWYEAADLYVLSSRFEGFPNTLVEAMSYGLPAVSFDCDTGPRDIIQHGMDGFLVAAGDDSALEAALRKLMGDEAMRRRFGESAIDVRERFSLALIIDRWEILFRELHENVRV